MTGKTDDSTDETNSDPIKLLSIGTFLCMYDIGSDILYTINCIKCATEGCIAKEQSNIAIYVILLTIVYLSVSIYGFVIYWSYYFQQKPAVEAKEKIMRNENVMAVVIQCLFTIFKSVNIWTILALVGKIASFIYCAYGLKKKNQEFKKIDIAFPILIILWTILVLVLGGFDTSCDCPF